MCVIGLWKHTEYKPINTRTVRPSRDQLFIWAALYSESPKYITYNGNILKPQNSNIYYYVLKLSKGHYIFYFFLK